MAKIHSYKIADTTKVQREKYVNDALSISVLDVPEPSQETQRLMRDYVDGKCEISDVLETVIERHRAPGNA